MSVWAKRHYETVARAIYTSKTGIPEIVRVVGEAMTRKPDKAVLEILMRSTDMDGTIDTLAHLFRIDNNNFDMERFKHACKTGELTCKLSHWESTNPTIVDRNRRGDYKARW